MTICLAALCETHTIIGASDRMITAGDVEFEPDQVKIWWMNPSVAIMVSGNTPLQSEILLSVQAEVSKRIELEPDNWWTVSEVADLYVNHYNEIRTKRAESALLTPLGLTYDTFLSRQAEMSSTFLTDLSANLLNFELPEVSAIIAGIDPTGAHLWLVSKGFRGVEATCYDSSGFVSIGMGNGHAQSQLMFARHTRYKPFAETLFLTYLAKKRAEVAPGVGAGTDMFLITGLGQSTGVDVEIKNNIDKIYKNTRRQEAAAFRRAGKKATQYVAQLFEEAQKKDQGEPADDGLVSIELSKDYHIHKAGEIVRFDPGRAAWLRDNGYEAAKLEDRAKEA